MTISVTKTVGTSLHAWQTVATANVVVGSAQDVSTKFAAAIAIFMARSNGTAYTAGWPQVRIEGSAKSSGNDAWVELFVAQMALGASIVNTTLNGAVTAGDSTCVVTSATNIASGDLLYLGHTTTASNYELVKVKSVSGTTVTFEEPCTNNHDTGALVTDQAERYFPRIELETYSRIRAVIDNAGGGQSVIAQVLMTTFDSLNDV